MNRRWTHSNKAVYNLGYHLVWCPKFRRNILFGKLSKRLSEIINKKAEELDIVIENEQINGDHVHLFVKCSPIDSPHFIVQQLFFKNWVKKFQIIQKDYDLIIIRLVGTKNSEMNEIENRIRILMGKNCKVQWDFVKEIKPTKSGKYLYTVCEVK